MIKLCGLLECPSLSCTTEVDQYVPLRFRSYVGLLGASYVRIGNFRSSLLEFLVDPNSCAIPGLTLTSFDLIHDFLTLELPFSESGLPIVEWSEAKSAGPPAARRFDINQSFSVAFSASTVEIDLGQLANADRSIDCSSVEFFVEDDVLVGLRIGGLSKEQVSLIRSQRTI